MVNFMHKEVSKLYCFILHRKFLIFYVFIDLCGQLEYGGICVFGPCRYYYFHMPISGQIMRAQYIPPGQLGKKLWSTWLWQISKKKEKYIHSFFIFIFSHVPFLFSEPISSFSYIELQSMYSSVIRDVMNAQNDTAI